MSYSTMKATKSSKSSTIDFNISKKQTNKIKKIAKKSKIAWLPIFIMLAFGFAGGFFAHKYIFSTDTYTMIGADTIYIGGDENLLEYTEQGVNCISFGKDISKNCTVSYYYRTDLSEKEILVDEVDETKPGMYYAVYKSPSEKYKNLTLIRNIVVLGAEV